MSDIEPTEIEWETPPAPRRQRGAPSKYHDLVDALRARPGEWAVFKRAVHSNYASQVRKGAYKAFRPAGSFEARSVNVGSGVADIYVRYVGEDGAS